MKTAAKMSCSMPLIAQAKDKRTSFDWFDAAVLSFKLTQLLICQADELLGGQKDTQLNFN